MDAPKEAHVLFVLALLACRDRGTTPDTGESVDTADTGSPETDPLVTPGPALGDCTPQDGDQGVALSGVLLLDEGPVFGAVRFQEGEIVCAGEDCDLSGAQVICTEGVIGAGVIDAHDHMQYNTLPPWQIDPVFEDRYDWQSDGRYWDYREAFDSISDDHGCEIMRWAETRALMSGSTSAVGVYYNSCLTGGVRNLDESSGFHGLDDFEMVYSASKVTTGLDSGDTQSLNAELASGELDAALYHVAEGWDASVNSEIPYMQEIGGSGEGWVYVHASDGSTGQLAALASEGTGVIWSPRSNLALYGGTTPVAVAKRMGLKVAIGPDWTPSGSHNPREELVCADDWLTGTGTPISDREIWAMGTSQAAQVLGLEGQIGSLAVGAKADLVVFPYSDTPYRQAIDSAPEDVRLVVVDGEAVFGAPELTGAMDTQSTCEDWDVCGQTRQVCVSWDVAAVRDELEAALSPIQTEQPLDYTKELYGLTQCEADERGPCAPVSGGSEDPDGDGVTSSADLCPEVWDPQQWDHDGDGLGDFCDPCPLLPDAEDCTHDPVDIDDDGVLYDQDLCPVHYDPAQEDSDGDGKGDACDPCPDAANPGDEGCPLGVDVIQDETHPDHPEEGERLTLSGLVVTGRRSGSSGGFFVQDPALDRFAAIYIYDKGSADVAVGDEVTVSGSYLEYNGLAELESPEVQVTGTGSITPLEMDPCEVGTAGSDAEAYEGMLVVVSGVSVTDSNPDAPSDYGAFVVDDCLWVDDTLSTDYETHPAEGTAYSSITGPMTYAYSERRILPRGPEDIQ